MSKKAILLKVSLGSRTVFSTSSQKKTSNLLPTKWKWNCTKECTIQRPLSPYIHLTIHVQSQTYTYINLKHITLLTHNIFTEINSTSFNNNARCLFRLVSIVEHTLYRCEIMHFYALLPIIFTKANPWMSHVRSCLKKKKQNHHHYLALPFINLIYAYIVQKQNK